MDYKYYFENADSEQKEVIALTAKNCALLLRDRFRREVSVRGAESFYLSFSGGFESFLLYWFIKCSDYYDEGHKIRVVSALNFMQHAAIKDRMYKCCDKILYPSMNMEEVKEKYGIPCFNKRADSIIHKYQNGNRRPYIMRYIYGIDTAFFKMNNTAGYLLMNGRLHKISELCCIKTKEQPLWQYEESMGIKSIVGVRRSESLLRRSEYHSCMQKSGKFTPLFDFTDFECFCMYDYFEIEKIYPYTMDTYTFEDFNSSGNCQHRSRTGCLGCPYGYRHGLKREFAVMSRAQKEYAAQYFGQSYDMLGFDYKGII